MKFDPFENRTCRDVRNQLGHEMITAILNRSMTGFSNYTKPEKPDDNQPHIAAYIAHRRTCLAQILGQISSLISGSAPDRCPDSSVLPPSAKTCSSKLDHLTCALLWNHRLFFEFHEWLEEQWTRQTGNQKKGTQGLILAAVSFEHLEYRRIKPARKLAEKSARFIHQYAAHLPEWVEPALWVKQLTAPDINPFKVNIFSITNKRGVS